MVGAGELVREVVGELVMEMEGAEGRGDVIVDIVSAMEGRSESTWQTFDVWGYSRSLGGSLRAVAPEPICPVA